MKPYHMLLLGLGGVLLLTSLPAGADGILTTIDTHYQAATTGWMTTALGYALRLFYSLVAIEIPFSAIYYLFYKDSVADLFAALLLKLLGLLFFWVLLQEAPVWIPTIIHSFTQAGADISGAAPLDPSGVFDQGIGVANTALQGVNQAHLWDAPLLIIVAGLAALIIVIAYAIIAAQLLVTLIESYIIMGGGVLLLGFAGSRWTLVFSERYLGYVVNVGVKLFVLYLLIGLGLQLAPQFTGVLVAATKGGLLPQPSTYFDIMGGALVFMVVGWQVPALAAAMMSGTPALTLGTAATTTAMLTAAVANGVAKGMQHTAASASQTTNAAASAVKLAQAATAGIGEARQGGADLTTAVRKTAGDISLAASQQFKDTVLRGTGQASAAAAEQAAGSQAVQGWGRGTTLGNLTNRYVVNQAAAQAAVSASTTPTASGSSGSAASGSASAGQSAAGKRQQTPADSQDNAPLPPEKPRQPINTISPPPIPPDGGHGHGITIRFNLPE